jgi:3'-phosphoadenosine 5'-phosphosulfate sulfotransferase (PAPS reductase)/FAD synthetase
MKHDEVEVIYADPGLEDPDNMRFLRDVEAFAGIDINILRSEKFEKPMDVFEKKKFLSSPGGAPCTTELKKIPITQYLAERLVLERQVIGYTSDEKKRIQRYKNNNPEIKLHLPLVMYNLSKADCQQILMELGIRLPRMYMLGYKNANCTGCVKAESIGYWAAIREDFPEIFEWYAKFERQIGRKDENGVPRGAAINKRYIKGERHRVFLDEIPADFPPKRTVDFVCGYTCGADDMEILENDLVPEPTEEASVWADRLQEHFSKVHD